MKVAPPDFRCRAFTLIELLVVIAIIGILMAMLFPAVTGIINNGKRAQAKNDAVQIVNAVVNYELEYGKMPIFPPSPTDVVQDVDGDLVAALTVSSTNNNPRKVFFLEVQDARPGRSGVNAAGAFVDPWGNAYRISLDGDSDHKMVNTVPSQAGAGTQTVTTKGRAAVWNTNATPRLNVRSWE